MPPLEIFEEGDIIKNKEGYFRRVLRASGQGEYRLYDLSDYSTSLEAEDFKMYSWTATAYDLESNGYRLHDKNFHRCFCGCHQGRANSPDGCVHRVDNSNLYCGGLRKQI